MALQDVVHSGVLPGFGAPQVEVLTVDVERVVVHQAAMIMVWCRASLHSVGAVAADQLIIVATTDPAVTKEMVCQEEEEVAEGGHIEVEGVVEGGIKDTGKIRGTRKATMKVNRGNTITRGKPGLNPSPQHQRQHQPNRLTTNITLDDPHSRQMDTCVHDNQITASHRPKSALQF